MKIETIISLASALIVVVVVIYPKQKDNTLDIDLEPLNRKIDSINILIKDQDRKIDSIYNGLNKTYETIDTSSNASLRDMLDHFPTRTRHDMPK